MRGISRLVCGVALVACVAPLAAQQAAVVKEALAKLESPFADERTEGKLELVAFEGDLSRVLKSAMEDAPECVQIELLDVATSRRDPALVTHAAARLETRGERVSLAARDYLLALSTQSLRVEASALGDARAAFERFVVFRRRYQMSLALIEAQLKPGKYAAPFEALRAEYGDALDDDLLLFASGSSAVCDGLRKAAQDRVARGLETGDVIRVGRFRRLQNADLLVFALGLIGVGAVDADATARLATTDASAFSAAVYMAQDLRVTAIRALTETANADDMSDRLAAFYATSARDSNHELLKRLLDQDALREEVEVVLARFGRTELLEARIAALRARYEQPATGQVNAQVRNAAEVETQARNAIALLYLRAGDAAEAEREWMRAVDQVNARMSSAGGRQRTALAATQALIYYNLACALSLQGKTSRALGSLRKAVENGYADFAWVLEDGDLAALREHPAFLGWFNSVAPPHLVDLLSAGR